MTRKLIHIVFKTGSTALLLLMAVILSGIVPQEVNPNDQVKMEVSENAENKSESESKESNEKSETDDFVHMAKGISPIATSSTVLFSNLQDNDQPTTQDILTPPPENS